MSPRQLMVPDSAERRTRVFFRGALGRFILSVLVETSIVPQAHLATAR